jgi:folate-dependent phosphoribosylglycinamide formyltransferase PurN
LHERIKNVEHRLYPEVIERLVREHDEHHDRQDR